MSCTLVIGGARSGKSKCAEHLARKWEMEGTGPVIYLATAQITDEEMGKRIKRHQDERPSHWLTVEEPLCPHEAIRHFSKEQIVILDCLSLLLNNWMFLGDCSEEQFFSRVHELCSTIAQSEARIIVVTNEVGQGIVPADGVTRKYRDWLGWFNQEMAQIASTVIWVVAGIPVDLRKVRYDI